MVWQVINAHDFRGLEVNTDHYTVVSKSENLDKMQKVRNISGAHKIKAFKAHLLHGQSIRDLYKKSLTEYA